MLVQYKERGVPVAIHVTREEWAKLKQTAAPGVGLSSFNGLPVYLIPEPAPPPRWWRRAWGWVMKPFDDVEDAGSRLTLQATHDAALAQVAEHERRAEEFGFEPYGTPAEEAASYNRHLAAHLERLRASHAELASAIAKVKRHRNGRIALVAAGCLLACVLLWVAAVHWWWPL